MKNIHIIPTDKPSRLYLVKSNNKLGITSNNPEYTKNFGSGTQNQYIYITNSEEIKEGVNQWYLDKVLNEPYNSGGAQYSSKQDVIIITTDQDLIADGVQAIDDEFLEWFVKNPSCEEVEVFQEKHHAGEVIDESYPKGFFDYKIIIPKELKQDPLEQAAKEYAEMHLDVSSNLGKYLVKAVFQDGGKWKQEQDKDKFSEEQVLDFANWCRIQDNKYPNRVTTTQQLLEQFKKK